MAKVRSKHTVPERVVRSICRSLGFRYRLHRHSLPGSPDLVFPSLRRTIFVHGCFWHRHACPNGQRVPRTKLRFWNSKFEDNVKRDRRARADLKRLGWDVLVIWECQTTPARRAALVERLRRFLAASPADTKR